MPVIKKRSYDIWLGSFVALALIALLVVVFLIGRERRLFERTVAIEAHFPNVAGLAVGADVMLAGLVVGHVSAIKLPIMRPEMPGLSRDVTVIMEIAKRDMAWVREDSIARIDSKGLLGDKLINISIGSSELPEIQVGGMLTSTPPVDFNKALQQAQEILENVTETVADAKDIFKGFVTEGGDEALAASAKSLKRLFEKIEKGDGVLHELIYDKEAGKDTKASLKSFRMGLDKFAKVSDDVSQITHDAKQGQGLLHALVYDKAGATTISNLNQGLHNLSAILDEIKGGSGIAHDLIYESGNKQFLRSLNKAALDLEMVAKDLKNGKGSLGLLLTDPSLYNELYGLIGNLRRNLLLKSVIRYGISHSEKNQ
ncbi:MAG TPA: MlaD family protein [Myxococcota bacterium]|nr:MlaD family protein [Myxococcota bacterium]